MNCFFHSLTVGYWGGIIILIWSAAAIASPLQLSVNEGKLHRFSVPVLDVLITDPGIADIQMTRQNGLFIYGKKPGKTHIVALTEDDRVILDRHVEVVRDLAELRNMLAVQFPENPMNIMPSRGRLILSGSVSSPSVMDQILLLVGGYLEEGEQIVNRLQIETALQVNLRIRIMEMNRQATKELGINWDLLLNPGSFAVGLLAGRTPAVGGGQIIPNPSLTGTGGSALIGMNGSEGSINAVIDAMAEDNLVTVLAEPNLTSRSGDTASFFAGGEFPIPVGTDDEKITIEFKKYGVILDMTPTVLSRDRIRLHIRPEVSELSSAGSITLQNISIPAIAVRRTEATIELASGQSFSVAGLLQNRNRDVVREVPGLADLDILGPLFRSRQYQRAETELVIIATANIVRPLNRDVYQSPLTNLETENPYGSTQDTKAIGDGKGAELKHLRQSNGKGLQGPVGFIY